MFSKKKIEDQFDKIINAEDLQQKSLLLKKQIEFLKSKSPEFEYEFKDFLKTVEEYQTSQKYEYNLLWLQLINEIIRLDPTLKKRYFKPSMKIVFTEINENEENKDEIYKVKINTINIFTNKCEDIFSCDPYFQNLNHLKSLLKLLIVEILPHFYSRDNNILLLMIVNLFLNINKDIINKKYLKSNYISVVFNLLIEILCFQSLYYSIKVLEMKTKRNRKNTVYRPNFNLYESIIDLDINNDNNIEKDKNEIIDYIDNTTKVNLLDLLDKANILFNLYLNLNEKNNLNIIINYQILMKIFLIHCIESKYNENKCIEFFKLIIKNFKMNKILKMIMDCFDDEIFNLFYINDDENEEEKSNANNLNGKNNFRNNKLKSINVFFYLCEYRTKEIESKNYYNNFVMKFNKLRNKLFVNKEYINNGLFILINLLLNDILSKTNNNNINFEEEIIIITLIKCVMKYIIKTNIIDMNDNNKNNIDNFVNLLIDRFGVSLSEKIWKELMVLIKYYYFELSKYKNRIGIEQIKAILKKMLKLKVNGNYKFDENLFYDILNKVCENKNKNNQINDYVLYSIYIKNKFKSSIYFNKNIFGCTDFFISLIKEKYSSFEDIDTKNVGNEINQNKENKEIKKKFNSDEILDILANYILIYLYTYSKYENKNIELFIYKNFIHLNFYFSLKKSLQSQYINLIIKNLNNTNDLNYFQCLISYIISLHSNQGNFLKSTEVTDQTLNIYKKIIIKLIKKLSETQQIEKLDYLFESIYNRLEACISNDIDYNFLNNILEIFRHTYITKFEEILINNKAVNNFKTLYINEQYLNIGQNYATSIISGNNKEKSKKVTSLWCVINIKELFIILLKLLKKNNINIEYKEKIINFINGKITDIFFLNKMDVDSFIDYIIELDKNTYKEFMEKSDIIMTINEILKNIAYLLIYHKHLFEIKNYKETYEKLIKYVLGKINYLKKIILLIINKYEFKILKNRNWKNLMFRKNLLGIDNQGMPNIDHLKLDQTDFKLNKKDKEKDINYQIFVDLKIDIDKFIYLRVNFGKLIKYFKSYFQILGISLNSLSYNYIKNAFKLNISFSKQIEEKKLNTRFDKDENALHIHQDNSNFNKINNNSFSNEILKKYSDIPEKIFNNFNKMPLILKYHSNFLIEYFKFFLYSKDFLISCGEKCIIKSVLILFNISFPEFYNKILNELNKEFKNKYNDGKDFFEDNKNININNNNTNNDLINNDNENKAKKANILLKNFSTSILYNSVNNIKNSPDIKDLKNNNFNDFHSKSVIILKENDEMEKVARKGSIDENFNLKIANQDNIDINIIKYNNNESKNEPEKKIKELLILIRKLLIEYIIKSKNSLKIYNIINNIISQLNNEENNLFLLFFKWKMINNENINRSEDINIFKNKRKIKNYFGGGIHNISIENLYPNKTISIKSPISNTNYKINNIYKKIPYKNLSKIIMKSFIPEKEVKDVENILNIKHSKDSQKITSIKEKYIKSDSNTFCFASSPNIALNEIKELENEDKDNLSDSENDKNNIEDKDSYNEDNDIGKYIDNDDKNIPNLEELISVMHSKTINDSYKYYSNSINDLNNISHQINNIDKSIIYNEMEINVMYIINYNNTNNLDNIHFKNFMKFLNILSSQEEEINFMRINDNNEFIYTDNFNITKYVINNNSQKHNQNYNYEICLIFNNTLQNKTINNSGITTNINIFNNNDKVYLYIFIIPISQEYWKIEFKFNTKKKDEFLEKIKYILDNNFLNCYILSIKNDFSYIVHHLKILISLLQDLICLIKKDINDKKLLTKLQGIKHEEIFERINLFKSIN